MKFKTRISTLLLLLALSPSLLSPAFARGGFGGGGGGFGGGRGFGGGLDRGGFDRGDVGRGDFDRGFNDMFDRQGGDFGRVDDAASVGRDNLGIKANEDGVRNFADSGRTPGINHLATDGGFGKVLNSPAANWSGHLGTYNMNPAYMATHGANVQGAFNHWNYFNHDWWHDHPWGWYNRYWGNDWAWGYTGWGTLGGWWGMDVGSDPVYYDYGNNITYQNDQVYYGSQPLESSDAYYQQAQTLADSAPPAPTAPQSDQEQKKNVNNMKPLGVFALVSGDQDNSSQLIQLAVDKKGFIHGTYFNEVTNESREVKGAVDKKNQRACFTIQGNSKVVYDTAIGNLLKSTSPILVHYSKSNTQQLMMVRLKNPNTTNS